MFEQDDQGQESASATESAPASWTEKRGWRRYLTPGHLYMVVKTRADGIALGVPELAEAPRYFGVLIVETSPDGAPLNPHIVRFRLLGQSVGNEEDMLSPLYAPQLVTGDRNGAVVEGHERRRENGRAVSQPQGWFLCEIR